MNIDCSENPLEYYYQQQKEIKNSIDNIHIIIKTLEEKSHKIAEEIRLLENIRQGQLQSQIQSMDNVKLSQETEYLEQRLKILEKRQIIELGLLEKKFQWEHGVQQLQKKYKIQLSKLNLSQSTQTIHTYHCQIDISKQKIAWDYPPFDNTNPSYHSQNYPNLNYVKTEDQLSNHPSSQLQHTPSSIQSQVAPQTPPPPPPLQSQHQTNPPQTSHSLQSQAHKPPPPPPSSSQSLQANKKENPLHRNGHQFE